MVTLAYVAAVGVPPSVPLPLMPRPKGNPLADQENVPEPPCAEKPTGPYGCPTWPGGRPEVTIDSAG